MPLTLLGFFALQGLFLPQNSTGLVTRRNPHGVSPSCRWRRSHPPEGIQLVTPQTSKLVEPEAVNHGAPVVCQQAGVQPATSGFEALIRGRDIVDRRTGVGHRVRGVGHLTPRGLEPSSVESERSSQKNPVPHPWSRSAHPEGVAFLVRGVRAFIPKESRSSSVESERSSRRSCVPRPWSRASRPSARDPPPPKRSWARRPWNRASRPWNPKLAHGEPWTRAASRPEPIARGVSAICRRSSFRLVVPGAGPPSRKRRGPGTRWQRCTVRLLRAGSRQADHSLVTQKKTRERLPREPDPSSKGPTSRTGKPTLNVSPVERRPARRTEAGAASRTRGRLQPKPLRDPCPSNGASPPWSRGARPRSRSAWPASRPRSRPSEDRGPPPRGAGPVARGIDAAAGEPTSSTSSPEQLPSRRAGVGAASRNRNHQPPKRYQARHPANGSLSSVEPRPTPAKADQGSTSIGFEHHSSVQSEASQGIRNPCPANRAKLPHPMGSRCPAGKPAWSLLPVAEPRASSRRSRCALVPIVDAGGSQCQGVRQQAGIGPSSAFGRIASSRRTSRPNPRCRAPRPEGVGAIGFFERPDSISEQPVSQRAGVAAGPCVRAEHVIPEESVMQHAMPGASSRGSRCLRPGERSRSPEEGD